MGERIPMLWGWRPPHLDDADAVTAAIKTRGLRIYLRAHLDGRWSFECQCCDSWPQTRPGERPRYRVRTVNGRPCSFGQAIRDGLPHAILALRALRDVPGIVALLEGLRP